MDHQIRPRMDLFHSEAQPMVILRLTAVNQALYWNQKRRTYVFVIILGTGQAHYHSAGVSTSIKLYILELNVDTILLCLENIM